MIKQNGKSVVKKKVSRKFRDCKEDNGLKIQDTPLSPPHFQSQSGKLPPGRRQAGGVISVLRVCGLSSGDRRCKFRSSQVVAAEEADSVSHDR